MPSTSNDWDDSLTALIKRNVQAKLVRTGCGSDRGSPRQLLACCRKLFHIRVESPRTLSCLIDKHALSLRLTKQKAGERADAGAQNGSHDGINFAVINWG